MATSSDDIIGEVSSTSVRMRKLLGLTSKQISKNKEFSPKIHHLRKFNEQQIQLPLTANLSSWAVRRRFRFVRSSVDDHLKQPNLDKEPASRHAATVQLRQCFPEKRSVHWILFRLGTSVCEVVYKNSKIVDNGLDIYFDTDKDALAYFNLLRMELPIKLAEHRKSPANETYITAMVCSISREDLIYLRSDNVSGPLMLCTRVTNSVSLLNPFTLIEKTVSADEYWNEPTAFEIYKSVKDLVEYIVLEVTMVSTGGSYSLLDVDVARVADFGKNDIVFTTRTLLGNLKPGDHALGYDLYAMKEDSTVMGDELKESLADVILVKKTNERMRTRVPVKKNISLEYEAFLRDLEKNPEALFSLSLNGENNNNNKAEKQQSGVNSMVEGKESDFDLEDLLADLALVDQPDVDAAWPSDEQPR